MSEIAEFLRALNGALGLICIAICVYYFLIEKDIIR